MTDDEASTAFKIVEASPLNEDNGIGLQAIAGNALIRQAEQARYDAGLTSWFAIREGCDASLWCRIVVRVCAAGSLCEFLM